ncbi:MAG: histidine kinase [Bacteroidia bacterium]|nr:histidine kinase [Bacteroidia bacterium]
MKDLFLVSCRRPVVKIRYLFNFLLFVFISQAQQPAYFKLGEDQFRGIQIYDVIQDKNLNYLFATSEGIYYFDYYSYKKIECDKTKSSSVFNFVIDSEGAVYCHNLNNQIFKIKNAECELFYELKSDERRSDISLMITDKNELVIGARKIIVLNSSAKVVKRFSFINHYLGPSFMAPNKAIHFHLGGCDTVLVYQNDKFTKQKIKVPSGMLNKNSVLKIFSIDSKIYSLDLQSGTLYKYNILDFEFLPAAKNELFDLEGSKRIYETVNEVWIAGTLPGVGYFNGVESKFFYEDHFISNVFKDQEGNILLTTFDKGVLVIPDLKVPDVINSFRDDPVTAIHANNKHGLIIGTSKGKLLNYLNGELHELKESAKRSLEGIYGDVNGSFILFDNGGGSFYDLHTGKMKSLVGASLKDAAVISENKFFVGTNLGIYKIHRTPKNEFTYKLVKGMNYRIYGIEYDRENSDLYASTANGLFRIDSMENTYCIKLKNEDIYPNSLYEHEGNIYVCTEKNGIIVLKNGEVSSVIETKVDGKTQSVKKVIIANNTLIANLATGLFQYDRKGKPMRSISATFGLGTKRVIDFKIFGEDLCISHSGGVQRINLNLTPSLTKPTIRFDKILINERVAETNESTEFKSDQRKFQFVFSSPTLKNVGAIKYHYKLRGNDSTWNINDFEANRVTYNALDGGSYTFMVKAENQGEFSKVLEYSFTIAQPLYTRGWFLLLVGVVIILFFILIYKWQLKLHQKKSKQINELNASKLAAIQSQMNPHFIFNSLNSIQDLVLKGDVENSYSYITTFSDLVRRTLSYSEKDFIEFEQEIKLLELYLSLEKLRFKKNFSFEIDKGNVEDILIPPMLIQPFIENSLAHGLLHKEGEKKLKIWFELSDVLICKIEDNGIGREKAKAIKQRQSTGHESFSGKAIGKRLEILSDVFEGDFGYSYEDLYDRNEAIGTRVVLTIPIKRKF